MMEFLMKAWEWVSSEAAAMWAVALLGLSEALASIPLVKSNSVFQLVVNALKWVAEKAGAKKDEPPKLEE